MRKGNVSTIRKARRTLAIAVIAASALSIFIAGCSQWNHTMGAKGRSDKEIARSVNTIRRLKGNPHSHYRLALHYQQRDRHREAIKEFSLAVAIDPTYRDALNGMGISFDKVGDYTRAQRAYRMALRFDPTPDLLNNFGYSLIRSGDHEQAVIVLEKAVALDSNVPRYHNNLGRAYFETGQYSKALAHFTAGMEEPAAHFILGRLLYKKGLYPEAKEQFSATLKMKPAFQGAQEALEAASALVDISQNIPPSRPAISPEESLSDANESVSVRILQEEVESAPITEPSPPAAIEIVEETPDPAPAAAITEHVGTAKEVESAPTTDPITLGTLRIVEEPPALAPVAEEITPVEISREVESASFDEPSPTAVVEIVKETPTRPPAASDSKPVEVVKEVVSAPPDDPAPPATTELVEESPFPVPIDEASDLQAAEGAVGGAYEKETMPQESTPTVMADFPIARDEYVLVRCHVRENNDRAVTVLQFMDLVSYLESIEVEVVNRSGREQLTSDVQNYLNQRGYKNISLQQNGGESLKKTKIYYLADYLQPAFRLAKDIPGYQDMEQVSSFDTSKTMIQLVMGRDMKRHAALLHQEERFASSFIR